MTGRSAELLALLQERVVIADGAMGTMLYRDGFGLDCCYEALNIDEPGRVKSVHRQYVVAGAELIEANTFGANRVRLDPHGMGARVEELCAAGVGLARAVAGDRVFVGGSVGPLGLRAGQELPAGTDAVFHETITALANAGADVLLLETFVNYAELQVAYKVAREATDLPIIVQVAVMGSNYDGWGGLRGEGEFAPRRLGADVFGLNCGKGPRQVIHAFESLVLNEAIDDSVLLSAFPNAGQPEMLGGRYVYVTTPEYMASAARQFAQAGAVLIGGCCGTTPADIAAMKMAVRGVRRVLPSVARARLREQQEGGSGDYRSPTRSVVGPLQADLPEPPAWNLFERICTAKAGSSHPCIVVELDGPKDLDVEQTLLAARKIAAAGVSGITVGDNPLAVVRMSNLVVSHLIQRETGLPVVAHMSCRDHNLIGLQSALMGAYALGLRAVLPVTGDPASLGNQPGAASVYDTNSFGLIEMAARLTERDDHGDGTGFLRTGLAIGVAFNPNGLRMDGQLRRLEKKVRLGARFVLTQPCYDIERIRAVYSRTRHLGVPVFIGLLPIFNERMAAFLHNEVPGIDVPEALIERVRGLEKEEGRVEGLRILEEIIEAVFDVASGYYVIPPFNSARHAVAVIESVRKVALRNAATDKAMARRGAS